MRIECVNVGKARPLQGESFQGSTGIYKTAVDGPVEIGELGLAGDEIIHRKHHGGPDQAVYLYRGEDYAWWSRELDAAVATGTFGENLTLSGLPSADMAIGTRLCFDEVVLEACAPRIPCNILAQRMGNPKFAKQFIRAERPGIYCRVIETGTVRAGEAFTLDASQASAVTILEIFRADTGNADRAALERFLTAPIDVRTRTKWEKVLARQR